MADKEAQAAGVLAFDILRRGYHVPLVDGKGNRDKIEDHLVRDIYNEQIPYILNQSIVDLAIDVIDGLIKKRMKEHGITLEDVEKRSRTFFKQAVQEMKDSDK
jgi:hypothetical protein